MGAPEVKIYTLSTCIHCKRAKELLTDKNINFECIDVDLLEGDEKEEAMKELDKVVSKRLFPTIIIGDTVIQGFKEIEIKKALKI